MLTQSEIDAITKEAENILKELNFSIDSDPGRYSLFEGIILPLVLKIVSKERDACKDIILDITRAAINTYNKNKP